MYVANCSRQMPIAISNVRCQKKNVNFGVALGLAGEGGVKVVSPSLCRAFPNLKC